MLENLPAELRSALYVNLEPGETIRWAAVPPARRFYFVDLALGLTGIWLLFQGFRVGFDPGGGERGIGFVAAVFGTLLFLPMVRSFVRPRQAVFAITDRRALAIGPGWWRSTVKIFLPSDIQFRKKTVRYKGLDDLMFARVLEATKHGLYVGDAGFSCFAGAGGAELAIEALLPSPPHIAQPEEAADVVVPPSSALPTMLWNAVEAELRPGERIEWFGSPQSLEGWLAHASAIAKFLAGGLAAAFILGILLVLFSIAYALLGPSGAVLAVIFAALFVIWVVLVELKERELFTVYLVTNIRAMRVAATPRGRKVWSSLPSEIDVSKKTVREDGSGDIYFLHEKAGGQRKGRACEQTSGFSNIADVAFAEAALNRLVASHSAHAPHGKS